MSIPRGTAARPGLVVVGLAICVLSFLQVSCGGGSGPRVELVVSAASDLSPVLAEITPLFEKETGIALSTNLGSTGQLMEQIVAGASVDVFLAASSDAVNQLDQKGLLVKGSARLYARGRLVMWTREGSGLAVESVADLAGPAIERISIANPTHAPYGRAAREALESAGVWDQIQPKIVPAENVRQAFQFAESGNVDVGLVALSLVATGSGSYTVVPDDLYSPINQTLAIVGASSHQAEAAQLVAFLTGPSGRAVLQKYGFVLPGE